LPLRESNCSGEDREEEGPGKGLPREIKEGKLGKKNQKGLNVKEEKR